MPNVHLEPYIADPSSPIAKRAAEIAVTHDPLELRNEIALWRALIEQRLQFYEAEILAYEASRATETGRKGRPLPPPSVKELALCLDGLRRSQEALVKVQNLGSVPRELVVALAQRIKNIVVAYCPETERQQAILKAIGSIDLPY